LVRIYNLNECKI